MRGRIATWEILCRISLTAALLCLMAPLSHGQADWAVCRDGLGQFATRFSTGVSVRVGAAHEGGFAQRSCEAELTWRGEQVVVVHSAAKVDIEVLGADLGLDAPVVAFEVWRRPAKSPTESALRRP